MRDRYPYLLFGLYALCWLALAIAPNYRDDWLLENVLVFVAVPVLALTWRQLSHAALTAVMLFLFLHAIGAHYTYAEVPYEQWTRAAFGHSLNELLGWQRNHFDRLVHFLYGLLVTPAFVELIDRRVLARGLWHWLLPFTFMASHAVLYEVIEWCAAELFGGDLGVAYLGTQGDVWDAQKDSALAVLGAAFAVAWCRLRGRVRG